MTIAAAGNSFQPHVQGPNDVVRAVSIKVRLESRRRGRQFAFAIQRQQHHAEQRPMSRDMHSSRE